jgi:MOSC domain-containing protein YiiM
VTGTVLQVNISPGGIPKRAVSEAYLHALGLEGDSVAHPAIHGGPQKAVLLLCSEALAELAAAGFDLYPGALGENLTIGGLDRTQFRPGQQYRVGDAIIEITKPRQPCKTIGVYGAGIQKAVYDEKVKAGDPSSPRWGLAGFYALVVQPGRVSQGAPIALIGQPA